VQFDVTTAALAGFASWLVFLLMPPGSGKEYLVIGGGTPPYKLMPLAAAAQAFAQVELKGTVIEVDRSLFRPSGVTDVTVVVEDSAIHLEPTALGPGANPRFAPSSTLSRTNCCLDRRWLTLRSHQLRRRANGKVRVKIEKPEPTSKMPKKLIALGTEEDTTSTRWNSRRWRLDQSRPGDFRGIGRKVSKR